MRESPEHDKKMTLVEHLVELRVRLLRSLVAVGVVFAGLFYFADRLYLLVAEPLMAYLPEGSSMIATEVASPFLTPIKLSIYAAIILTAPFQLHQLWGFVAPALYKRERGFAYPLLLSSVLLFYGGIAFAYWAVFPLLFHFFTTSAPAGVVVMTDMSHYLDFVLRLFLAFGLTFEVPIATALLVRSQLVSPERLARARPYVFLGCFVLGMLLTPPDIVSQFLLAVPMWLLFELGLLLARARFFQPPSSGGINKGERP